MSFDSYFKYFRDRLTTEQIGAITCSIGPTVVQAGAGSGKTSVIAHRFVYLVKEHKIAPERILLVTFTNQAVRNMERKIKGYVADCLEMSDDDVNAIYNNVNVMTFHAFCKRMLEWIYDAKDREATTKFTYDAQFFPVVKEVLKEYPHIRAAYRVKDILLRLRKICKSQNRDFTEDDLVDIAMNVDVVYEREKILKKYPINDMREIYVKFDEMMKGRRMGTLDDILLEANRYIMSDEEIVREWSGRYDAILCDEFQDVDDLQFNVLTKLSSGHNNLFCVGDPAQAIYGFRGSISHVFPKLERYFADRGIAMQKCKLTKNFRSTPQIVNVANALVKASKMEEDLKKELNAHRDNGEMPTFQILDSEQDQAVAIVQKIEELKNQGVKLSDMAILARKRVNYTRIKNILLYQSIHYEDYKETFPLLKRKVIRDVVGWISIAFIRDDDRQWFSHLKRIYNTPPSGIGAATFQKILDRAQSAYGNVMDVIEDLAAHSGNFMLFVRKIKKIKAIADDQSLSLKERYWKIVRESGIWNYYLKKYGENSYRSDTIQKFLDSPIVAEAESWNGALRHVEKYLNTTNQDRVICSTIHGVKGLEFKHVFLISVSEGNIPSSRGLRLCKNVQKREAYIEDERKVFYVAITRAKDNLYMFSDKKETSIFLEDVKSFLRSDVPLLPISNIQRRRALDQEMANEEINMDDDEYMEGVFDDGSSVDVL